jgi:hypothetical protein
LRGIRYRRASGSHRKPVYADANREWAVAARLSRDMTRIRTALFALTFCVSSLASAPISLAQVPSTEVTAKIRAIAATRRHQMELPKEQPEPEEPPANPSGFWKFLNRLFGFYAEFVRILFYVFLFAGLAFLIASYGPALVERLQKRREPDFAEGVERDALSPDGEGLHVSSDPVGQAKQLAAEGRTAEAVFVLLLAAVRLFRKTFGLAAKASFTNRELLGRIERSSPARQAFGELVKIAELVRFAGRMPTVSDVDDACRFYQAFETGLSARG